MKKSKKILFILIFNLISCTSTDDYLREKAKKYSDILDPDSTIFRSIKHGLHYTIWCGELNSKNTFGGYVGWKSFRMLIDENNNVRFIILEEIQDSFLTTAEFDEAIYNKHKSEKLHSLECASADKDEKWVPFFVK